MLVNFRCKQNFFGDGLSCEPVPRFEGNQLILAQGISIIKVPFSGRGSKPINIQSKQVYFYSLNLLIYNSNRFILLSKPINTQSKQFYLYSLNLLIYNLNRFILLSKLINIQSKQFYLYSLNLLIYNPNRFIFTL